MGIPYLACILIVLLYFWPPALSGARRTLVYKQFVELLHDQCEDLSNAPARKSPPDDLSDSYVDRVYKDIDGVAVEPAMTNKDILYFILFL